MKECCVDSWTRCKFIATLREWNILRHPGYVNKSDVEGVRRGVNCFRCGICDNFAALYEVLENEKWDTRRMRYDT